MQDLKGETNDPLRTGRLLRDPTLLGRAHVHAPARTPRPRERRRRHRRRALRHGRHLPCRRPLRSRGHTERLPPPQALQPEPRRGDLRPPLGHRLRRRARRPRLHRGELQTDSGGPGADPPRRRHPDSPRRRPLHSAARAAGRGGRARAARPRAVRLPPRHLGRLLRPEAHARDAVPAGGGGGAARHLALHPGRDAGFDLRRGRLERRRRRWASTSSRPTRCASSASRRS